MLALPAKMLRSTNEFSPLLLAHHEESFGSSCLTEINLEVLGLIPLVLREDLKDVLR